MIPQLGGLVPKSIDLVITFCLAEGENIPQFHLRALQIRSGIFLLQNKTGQIKILQVNTSWNYQNENISKDT